MFIIYPHYYFLLIFLLIMTLSNIQFKFLKQKISEIYSSRHYKGIDVYNDNYIIITIIIIINLEVAV